MATKYIVQGGTLTFTVTDTGASLTAATLTLAPAAGGSSVYGPTAATIAGGIASWVLTGVANGNYIGTIGFVNNGESLSAQFPIDIVASITPAPEPTPPDSALNQYTVTPSFAPSSLPNPGPLYWGVTAQLVDVNGNVVSQSPESTLSQFLLDAPDTGLSVSAGGPGGVTWAALLQKDPLVPPQTFRLVGVLPMPGWVNQDAVPQPD